MTDQIVFLLHGPIARTVLQPGLHQKIVIDQIDFAAVIQVPGDIDLRKTVEPMVEKIGQVRQIDKTQFRSAPETAGQGVISSHHRTGVRLTDCPAQNIITAAAYAAPAVDCAPTQIIVASGLRLRRNT